MQISPELTDPTLLAELGARLERTRLERDMTQRELAEAASVGLNTIKRLEAGEGATLTNFLRVLRALGLLGGMDRALPVPTPSPMQQLRMGGRQRKKASGRHRGPRQQADEAQGWQWGDHKRR